MLGIRQKLMLGFGGLLAIVAVMGALTMAQIDQLGRAIDVILKENYRSVVACQDMKESLERMDSGILFTLAGHEEQGRRLIEGYAAKFREALAVETGNVTLPGEREMAAKIAAGFAEYARSIELVTAAGRSPEARREAYFAILQPLFQTIKDAAQGILAMNQANMTEANNAARRLAASAHRRMLLAIVAAALVAIVFSWLAQRWILRPIGRLIESADEIKGGNLDLVLESGAHDELGQLSRSFNDMTAALRQVRKSDHLNLMRTRRATEEVLGALPAAIAVLDLEGRVEIATDTADRHFGLKPGVMARDLGFDWLPELIQTALDQDRMVERESGYVQQFVGNREYFFQPMVVPIPVGTEGREPTGVALILKDVTQVREQRELKRGVVATVAHQLKTPLTSLRMSIHLLLEEKVGGLNETQTDLLLAARDDSERLVGILDDLLDIDRMESGQGQIAPRPTSPRTLAQDGLEPLLAEAKDKGVAIVNEVPDDLPQVLADPARIGHVFGNLLTNALRFTDPGGQVRVSATAEPEAVRFAVRDSGQGVPAGHVGHLFDPFYRAPGQDENSGVGLGLAIVKQIVLAHGGQVRAESQPGQGSVFEFTLPLCQDPAGDGQE